MPGAPRTIHSGLPSAHSRPGAGEASASAEAQADRVLAQLTADLQGLTAEEAADRLAFQPTRPENGFTAELGRAGLRALHGGRLTPLQRGGQDGAGNAGDGRMTASEGRGTPRENPPDRRTYTTHLSGVTLELLI